MKLPIDTTGMTFLAAGSPDPVVDYDSKAAKVDDSGAPIYGVQIVVLVDGGADVINVKVAGEPKGVSHGTTVKITGLVAAATEVIRSIRTWAHYRQGVRRRTLIIIDVLWAQAARLQDLSPHVLYDAANAKAAGAGKRNRARLRAEIRRSGSRPAVWWRSARLRHHLRHAEWRRRGSGIGLDRSLKNETNEWIDSHP